MEGQSVRGSPSSNPVGANDASALVPQLLFPPCNPSHQSHALTPVRSGRSGHLSPQTSNALVSHRPPLCSSRSVASVQHLLTPLALEAALEGADLNSVCYTAMGLASFLLKNAGLDLGGWGAWALKYVEVIEDSYPCDGLHPLDQRR